MIVAQCPTRDCLYEYSVGELSRERLDDISTHIENCKGCQAELATLEDEGDTLVGQLRAPIDVAYLHEPVFRRAVAEARTIAHRTRHDNSGSFVPHMLGEYELIEEIGRGGMGRVYKARHTKLNRIVAVKILPRGRLENPHSLARFEREMRAIGGLAHPQVVHAYDGREIDQMPVLVMEYVEGMDLAELVRRVGRLKSKDACELVRQAAVGLEYAHANGLVHRDIKPSNLMLARDGTVKLLDLGLARFYTEPSGDEVTGADQAMGTADYIAPEQVGDSRAVDIRADIYSLGATLYKLLAGRAPFSGPEYRGALAKMHAHVHTPPPPIEQHVTRLPAGVIAILARMLAKDPAERFATPAELLEAIGPLATGADTARLVEEAEQAEPLAVDASAGGGMLAAGTQPNLATEPHTKKPWWQWPLAIGLLLCMLGIGFAAGVTLTVSKNGKLTQVAIPDGAHASVNADGDVSVTIPDGTREGTDDDGASLRSDEDASQHEAAITESVRSDGWQMVEENEYRFPSELEGKWKIESIVSDDGQPSPYTGQTAEIRGSILRLKSAKAASRYHLTFVDPSISPIHVDLTALAPGRAFLTTRRYRCLLEVEKGQLMLYLPQNAGDPRPTSEGERVAGVTIFTLSQVDEDSDANDVAKWTQVRPLAMDGYCPTSVVAHGRWGKGNPEITVAYNGLFYAFAGEDEKTKFESDPQKYAPVLNGDDVVAALDEQQKKQGSREWGYRHDGRTYLFSSEENMAAFFRSPERYVVYAASLEQLDPAVWRPSTESSEQQSAAGDAAGAPESMTGTFFKPVIDEESFGLIRAADTNAFTAYSKRTGSWDTYRFPKQLAVTAWASGEFGAKVSEAIIGFELAGGPIEELVAIDAAGRFQRFELEEAIDKELRPVLMGHGVLYYIADGHVYAFSGITGSWDALKAPQLPDVRWKDGSGIVPDAQKDGFDTESVDGILVTFPDYVATFTAEKGVWQMTPNEPGGE